MAFLLYQGSVYRWTIKIIKRWTQFLNPLASYPFVMRNTFVIFSYFKSSNSQIFWKLQNWFPFQSSPNNNRRIRIIGAENIKKRPRKFRPRNRSTWSFIWIRSKYIVSFCFQIPTIHFIFGIVKEKFSIVRNGCPYWKIREISIIIAKLISGIPTRITIRSYGNMRRVKIFRGFLTLYS